MQAPQATARRRPRTSGRCSRARSRSASCARRSSTVVAQLVDWGRQGEVSYLPKMRTQLVAARTVAEVLAWPPG